MTECVSLRLALPLPVSVGDSLLELRDEDAVCDSDTVPVKVDVRLCVVETVPDRLGEAEFVALRLYVRVGLLVTDAELHDPDHVLDDDRLATWVKLRVGVADHVLVRVRVYPIDPVPVGMPLAVAVIV